MGRPSRKRSRVLDSLQDQVGENHENKPRKRRLTEELPLFCFEGCSNSNNSLQSLLKALPRTGGAHSEADGEEEKPQQSVQEVWGQFGEEDFAPAAAASGLSLGVNVEIDGAGVAWLLNSATVHDHHHHQSCNISSGSKNRTALPSADTGLSEKGSYCHQNCEPLLHTEDRCNTAPAPATATTTATTTTTDGASSSFADMTSRCSACSLHVPPLETNEAAPSSFFPVPCQAVIRTELLRLKGEFSDIQPAVFKRVRSACNPAEDLGSGSFLNRSAMKLANIDSILGRRLGSRPLTASSLLSSSALSPSRTVTDRSQEENETVCATSSEAIVTMHGSGGSYDDKSLLQNFSLQASGIDLQDGNQQTKTGKLEAAAAAPAAEEDDRGSKLPPIMSPPPPRPLLFADLCGGPGGFSEYLLRRRRQLGLPACGWGISLRGESAAARKTCPVFSSAIRAINVGDCGPIFRGETATLEQENNAERKRRNRRFLSSGDADDDDDDDAAADDDNDVWRKCSGDPCAWRLDGIASWCNLSTASGESRNSAALIEPVGRAFLDATRTAKGDDGGKGSNNHFRTKSGEKAQVFIEAGAINVSDERKPNEAMSRHCSPACAPATAYAINKHNTHTHSCSRGTSNKGGGNERRDHGTKAVAATRAKDKRTSRALPPTPAATAAAAAASPAITNDKPFPLLEMTIDDGPKGSGDLLDYDNMRGYVDNVLASTGGRRLDLVVADGGFGAARDAREQERLISPLVHSEVIRLFFQRSSARS